MNLLRFDTEAAWNANTCSLWRDRLRTTPDMTICLPTGTTPAAIYAEMSRSARAGLVSFAQARIFALDEFGGLDRDDPGRTRNTLQRQLLGALDLPPDRCHFLDPDRPDLEQHCRDYDAAIGGGFDLVLLGIGGNGHLGMNEPGSAPNSATRRVELHDSTIQSSARYFTHSDLPRWGLTVGLAALLGSKEVWLLANGAAKAGIIRTTVHGPVDPAVPSTLLRRHPNCSLLVDAEAGALFDTSEPS